MIAWFLTCVLVICEPPNMLQLAIVFLSVAISLVAGQCHQNWYIFGESCYGFGEADVTWGDAEEMCRAYGAKLVEIETAEENNWLKSMAKGKHAVSYWIGGADLFTEGQYEWVSVKQPISGFTDWADNQPDDFNGKEDCMALLEDDYKWNDWPCDEKFNFICEALPIEGEIIG